MNEITIENELKYIKKIANQYKRYAQFEDLVQLGYLGLLKAKEVYDPSKGVSSLWHASYYINGEMLHFLKRIKKHESCLLYEDTLHGYDHTQSRYDELEAQARLNQLEVALVCLPPELREAVQVCCLSEWGEASAKIKALKEREGISNGTLYQRRAAGLQQLKELLHVDCPSKIYTEA